MTDSSLKQTNRQSARRRRTKQAATADNSNDHDFASSSSSRIASLSVPWACLIVTAVLFAIFQQQINNDDGDDEDYLRQLAVGSTADEQQQQQHSQQQHHHHAVYEEEHAPLFPLTPSDYWGFFLATLGLMVAAGGGIGGGGILVPIYILVMGFTPKHAIPLSNITVFGGACANFILNTRKRHPLADRPLVDWDLILVMEPLTIAGALMGAFLNKILPELLLTVLLVLLLSFTAYNSLKKAFKMYKKETLQMQRERESELTRLASKHEEEEENDQEDDDDDDDEEDDEEEAVNGEKNMTTVMLDSRLQAELDDIVEQERTTPPANLMILVALFVVVLTINLLKGGGAFPSPIGIKCGSKAFWIANLIMIGWIVIISLFVRQYLIHKHQAKMRCRYEFLEGDIKWDARATLVYPVICCAAGFFAGMFGVGGGIVKGPLMLAMGVHPAVSSASSACMILFTSFTATTSFIVFGLLVPDYAVVCLCIGFTATLAGQLGLSYLMRKAGRNSYIVFSIGSVVLLSAFLMTIQSLLSMASGEKHHSGGICGKGD